MKRPNFLIIGAQKAGTTWLWERISQHPDVFVPEKKELSFFNRNRKSITDESFQSQYLSHFQGSDDFRIVGESTPGYFWTTDSTSSWCQPPHAYNDHIPETVKEFLGEDVRLVLCLRNPIERAISAFFHHFRHTKVINPDDRILEVGHRHGIVDMGFYFRHLQKWLEVFPRENILIFNFANDICDHPEDVMHRLFSFLDLKPVMIKDLQKAAFAGLKLKLSDNHQYLHAQKNANSSPVVHQSEIVQLRDIYAEDIQHLAKFLEWDLSAWLDSPKKLFPKRKLQDILFKQLFKKP